MSRCVATPLTRVDFAILAELHTLQLFVKITQIFSNANESFFNP